MKVLAILGMVSGIVLTILILRVLHSNWNDFGLICLYALVPNLITALTAYLLFRGVRV